MRSDFAIRLKKRAHLVVRKFMHDKAFARPLHSILFAVEEIGESKGNK